jgi:hypothetical protein
VIGLIVTISDANRKAIIWSGLILLVGYGALLYYYASTRWEALPNYKRVASFIPLTIGYTMVHVDGFCSWKTASVQQKWRTVGAVAINSIVILGSIAWWLWAPEAMA